MTMYPRVDLSEAISVIEKALRASDERIRVLYEALMIPADTPIEQAEKVARDMMDRVPVGRSFQERMAWCLNLPKTSTEDEIAAAINHQRQEYRDLLLQKVDAEKRVKELEERLQIDPGGSDKVDELEQCILHLRADLKHAQNLVEESEEVVAWCEEKGWGKYCTPRQFIQQLWEAQCREMASMKRSLEIQDAEYRDRCAEVLRAEAAAMEVPKLKSELLDLHRQLRRLQTGKEIESDSITDMEARQQSEIDALQKALRRAHEKMGPGYSQTGRGELSITTCDGCGESLPEGIEHTWEDCCKILRRGLETLKGKVAKDEEFKQFLREWGK